LNLQAFHDTESFQAAVYTASVSVMLELLFTAVLIQLLQRISITIISCYATGRLPLSK
jgi:hypothetical protein